MRQFPLVLWRSRADELPQTVGQDGEDRWSHSVRHFRLQHDRHDHEEAGNRYDYLVETDPRLLARIVQPPFSAGWGKGRSRLSIVLLFSIMPESSRSLGLVSSL